VEFISSRRVKFMYNKEVIEKAYITYKKKINDNSKLIEIENQAVQTISALRESIKESSNHENISFIHDFTFGAGPNEFAASMAIPLPGLRTT
jgi:predicted AAA+ superfamily ATPase